MASDPRSDLRVARPDDLSATIGVAILAVIGFRLGLLRGGLVGVDVLLAAAGWWFASGGVGLGGLRRRVAVAFGLLWPPVMAALLVTIAWLLLVEPTGADVLVRGQVLAGLGGYANWHLLSLGPAEALASRVDTPLQHLWALAVVVQCLLAWAVVVAATRGRAARRPDERDPAALAGLVLAGIGLAAGVALVAAGASGQAVLLSTPVRAAAFMLGAAVATAGVTPLGRRLRSAALGLRWVAVGGLVLVAVAVAPDDLAGRWLMAAIVPLLAAVAVAAAVPAADAASAGDAAVSRQVAARGVDTSPVWAVLVSSWVLVPPALALVSAVVPDAPAWIAGLLGLLIAAVLVAGVVWLELNESRSPVARERRRVLVPPAVVALVVLVFSLTGAFQWEGPQPLEQWEKHNMDRWVGTP